MHASERKEVICRLLGSVVSVEAPDSLAGRVQCALGRLPALPGVAAKLTEHGLAANLSPESGTIPIRLTPGSAGWRIELAGRYASAADEGEAVVRLQEMLLESTPSLAGEYLLVRGSIVARGSQCLLIVGDRGSTHAVVAVALTALGFRLASVGTAAFEGRSLVPLPLPLVFALDPGEQQSLAAAGLVLSEHLDSLPGNLFCPRSIGAAPEPTHVLFPETHAGSLSLVRPMAATAARSRLCQAMLSAPNVPGAALSPFASVASLLRHTRGVHLTLGDVSRALGQLGRLLPRWGMD